PVLEEIRMAQTREMITHRSKEFSALYEDLCTRLRGYLGAEEAYVLTCSGAAGLETLAVNLCKKDEKAACFPNGEFGDKLVETMRIYTNTDAHTIEGGWGWNLERAKAKIDESDADVLAMAYNETGYGIRNHIKEICKYAKSKGMITIIDGISAWPGTEFDMRGFSVDGFVTGSQKGIGAPPGMALVGLSKEAVERFTARVFIQSYCFDLRKHKKRYEKDRQTPNTPAVSLYWALQAAFNVLDRKGGVPAAVKRHADAAAHVRKRLTAMGFGMVAEKGFESNTVTGFVCESPEQAKTIKDRLDRESGIKIVGCRGAFKDNGLRMAHMANFEMKWLDECLDAIGKMTGK
ncbi:alanine--glyoxylate aminotransferase family protein, partial [Candidatus Micrarchaeota archaeon]|nr:alanine--glyoxylate aminotransferase family protein [Candidatus Micrarchaeota archaeon]